MIGQKRRYFENVAKTLYDKGVQSVSDVDFAYKRGLFRGMVRVLNEGAFEAIRLARDLENQEEGEG